MIQKGKELLVKYREIVVYLIVGVMTTIVSWAACFVLERLMNADVTWQNMVINTFGWAVGVLFAYPLNRKWVFQSTDSRIFEEFLKFASSRASTWALDIFVMWLTVNVLDMNYWIAKIFISGVLVTIVNYVCSKLLIFRKKAGAEGKGEILPEEK